MLWVYEYLEKDDPLKKAWLDTLIVGYDDTPTEKRQNTFVRNYLYNNPTYWFAVFLWLFFVSFLRYFVLFHDHRKNIDQV